MTQEQLNILSKYESNFKTALEHNYTKNIPSRELDVLQKIYEEHINNTYHFCKHCATSILNFMKRLGKAYENEIIKIEKQEEENENTRQSQQIKQGRKRK